VIYTGKRLTGPAEKNDLGILHSIGEICAFINDDVFPRKDWLKNAVRHFSDPTIAAVGGPGVTPEDNNLRQKASGYIYSSILGGGSLRFRYIPQKMREVDDYPSYNLLVRKKVLQDIGGFSSTFYGGEDTKLCLVIKKNGGRILYDPNVVVYHHRRPVFKDHLKQVWNVGLHRGYFVKKFPETSFRATYFLPPTFLIGGCIMLLSAFINANVWLLLKMILLMFLTACFLSAASSRNIRIMILVMLGIPLTQITYAATFLMGLCLKDLQR
jgi:GT2 family glycosyltransferase